MSENFTNILTKIGQQKKALAEATNMALNITTFKVGDGNGAYYEPNETQTALLNVKYAGVFVAGSQSQIVVNPTATNEVLYKCFIPANIGGFTIRELGLFDSEGSLILICKLPAQDKFALASGLYQPLTFTPKIIYTNPQNQAILTPTSQTVPTTGEVTTLIQEGISESLDGINYRDPIKNVDGEISLDFDDTLKLTAGKLGVAKASSNTNFCINSGNTTSGNADLLSYAGTTLSFKVGEPYPSALFTYADNSQEISTNIASITDFIKKYKNIATGANAISGGEYSGTTLKAKAFDGVLTGADFWGSIQQGASGIGTAYLGQKNLTNRVKKIKYWNYYNTADGNIYSTSSVKVQFSTDNGITWLDIATFNSLKTTNGATNEFILPNYNFTNNHQVRVLANATVNNYWLIQELQFFVEDENGTVYIDETLTILKEKDQIPVLTSSAVTQGKIFPNSPAVGDYHCLTATGLQTYKYNASLLKWIETQYVSMGAVSVVGGLITNVSTNSYNQNGYDIDINSYFAKGGNNISSILSLIAPDMSRVIGLGGSTNVTITKPGWVFVAGRTSSSGMYLLVNGSVVCQTLGIPGAWEEQMDGQVFVSAGDVVWSNTNGWFNFAPCKGVI